MRNKLVSCTPPWLGSSSCFDSLPHLLWRWTTSCKLKISHFLPKLLLVTAIYHSDRDPDCIRAISVPSWIKDHAVLPFVWTPAVSSFWAGRRLPPVFRPPGRVWSSDVTRSHFLSVHLLQVYIPHEGSVSVPLHKKELKVWIFTYHVSLQPLELPALSTKIL